MTLTKTQKSTEYGLRDIVIVGGGTSGWMAAAMISKMLRPEECRVTVIEPPGPRGIGVGESSVVSMVALLKMLGADEVQMMQHCEATYKLGIQFSDWHQIGKTNWHPFGVCGARIDQRDLFHFWLAERKRSSLTKTYHSYSLQWAACETGKSPHGFTALSPITHTQSYAFHFNAEALAGWLRGIALAAGVKEIAGTVQATTLNSEGDVQSVTVTSGEAISADFFIDCSGFESVLMSKALKDPFQDWRSHLLCDRAVAFKTPGKRIVPPYTKSQGMPSGWAWHIPLAHHVGHGYVYSSQFVSDDDAWEQLMSATTLNDSTASPRFLKMRVGRQTNFWRRNVLAIGLSAGFLEPLESSGIHLSLVGVEMFLKNFPVSNDWSPLQRNYNARMTSIYDDVRDFVQLHYALSKRNDTPFWIAAQDAALSPSLQRRLDLYDDAGSLDALQPEAVPETSYYHLLTGNDRLPRRASPLALSIESQQIQEILSAIELQNENALRDLPLHEELLNRIHNPVLAKAS